MPVPSHLIVVCCHAIYLGPGTDSASQDESNWLIEPFQAGETDTYIRHIEAGVKELARSREDAILIFSGAATKLDKTQTTEGEGYLNVAIEHDLFGLETSPPSLRQRIFVDRYATDSYQNILCSLIQFPSQTIRAPFPTKLTIVSHSFKRSRFLELHLPALRFPLESTTYIGINPPFSPAKLKEIEEGDRLRGYGAWEKDFYGTGVGLSRKREKRGWDGGKFRSEVLERFSDGELRRDLKGLLCWDGGSDGMTLWQGSVPWK
ncbi:uncharacterized protein A1O5_09869 [Cladophialophora psammophila CBS 110553]|uniref:DUF218 domain-containing protein n=1 Tax=Cladophialophora psammophila CBS 110553 TaxID=1182543 RepID=W9WGH4_9EURO|nr:uncharacterized protein A1O5_09869 [Cladophialophora psammophila CBS 110553]EXJ67222.1 hypothetical protein A1O5_09869 [Cladophialophora psammophila CBS 110553]